MAGVGVRYVDSAGAVGDFAPSPSCSRPVASRPTRHAPRTPGRGLATGQGARHPAQHRRHAAAPPWRSAPRRTATGRPATAWPWDAGAADEGDRELTNRLTRSGYPLGIVVNARGRAVHRRGRRLPQLHLRQVRRAGSSSSPDGRPTRSSTPATRPLLRTEEYDAPGTSEVVARHRSRSWPRTSASTSRRSRRTVTGVQRVDRRDRAVRRGGQGRPGARDVEPPKSNWAQPLESPPFHAFPVTCGITFTFGGLRADTDGRVLAESGEPIDGLFVCGEMLGGLFSGNYPGGTGLVSGAVFGRRAGSLA